MIVYLPNLHRMYIYVSVSRSENSSDFGPALRNLFVHLCAVGFFVYRMHAHISVFDSMSGIGIKDIAVIGCCSVCSSEVVQNVECSNMSLESGETLTLAGATVVGYYVASGSINS